MTQCSNVKLFRWCREEFLVVEPSTPRLPGRLKRGGTEGRVQALAQEGQHAVRVREWGRPRKCASSRERKKVALGTRDLRLGYFVCRSISNSAPSVVTFVFTSPIRVGSKTDNQVQGSCSFLCFLAPFRGPASFLLQTVFPSMPVKMRASPAILGATLLALSNFATAVPAGGSIERRDGDNDNNLPNAPWVEIDSLGQPSTTYTPTVTSVGGTTSPVHTAPHDLTASLYTLTNYGHVSTSTGLPPNPTVTNTHTNQGSFSRCVNPHGEFAPFCRPSHNSSVYVDSTYYGKHHPP